MLSVKDILNGYFCHIVRDYPGTRSEVGQYVIENGCEDTIRGVSRTEGDAIYLAVSTSHDYVDHQGAGQASHTFGGMRVEIPRLGMKLMVPS